MQQQQLLVLVLLVLLLLLLHPTLEAVRAPVPGSAPVRLQRRLCAWGTAGANQAVPAALRLSSPL